MRIALLASGFADYSLELAGALAERHRVRVLADCAGLARERGDAASPSGVEIVRFGQAARLQRWGAVIPLAAGLARWRPHAILAHEHPHPHLTALLALMRRIAPLGLIVHDPEPHPGRDAVFAGLRTRQTQAQRALATRLFTHGGACAERLRSVSGRDVTAILHGPILRPNGSPPPPPGAGRVLMFGRMEAYKGLDVLLQAARRLGERDVRFQLELRGAGPELDRLAPQFRALPGCAVLPGYASRSELLQALSHCDVVAASHLHASGSGVAAAALANHRGLVASATGGLQEAVRPGVNGVLTPPGDPDALAAGLIQALGRSQDLARGAGVLANGPFAWRHAAETIAEALRPRAASSGALAA